MNYKQLFHLKKLKTIQTINLFMYINALFSFMAKIITPAVCSINTKFIYSTLKHILNPWLTERTFHLINI